MTQDQSPPNSPPSNPAPENAETAAQTYTQTQPAPTMRTVLSQFCEEFETQVRPILEPLQRLVDALQKTPETILLRQDLHRFRDLRHEMQTLVDKVAEQQAYVLIFGPIKSGKSTFMNAICKAYVSEVTSLPAYPCMVYVSHSDTPNFVVTNYDGATETFTDHQALHDAIAAGHRQLTEKIRAVEARDEVFDPAVHMPEAIRKTDVKLPAGDLAKSGAVLVDTPGLYTRMKFGYDRMTRDFRNAAACAIFIVKADNLFLEQVFDEFNQLLELFSRIFLIVNLDTAKKDLQPDGTLAPSLEHKNPQAIITAFENLAMTAPLKHAADEGRLSLYPIDLLTAASRRILSAAHGPEVEEAPGQADFDALLQDLTGYLNSNEYLKAFLDDSLRRSASLLSELTGLCEQDAVPHLNRELEAMREQQSETAGRLAAAMRLQGTRWKEQLQKGLRSALQQDVERRADRIRNEALQTAQAATDEWFENSAGIGRLLKRLRVILQEAQESLPRLASEALREQGSQTLGGLASFTDVLSDLQLLDVDVRQLADDAIARAELQQPTSFPALIALSEERIPVRRVWSDWLLLRSAAAVRRRLFGPAEAPAEELAPLLKASRLGEPARSAIRQMIDQELDGLYEQAVRSLPEQIFHGYCDELNRALQEQLEGKRASMEERLKEIEETLAYAERAQQELISLDQHVRRISDSVGDLAVRFSQTEPARLTEWVGPEGA